MGDTPAACATSIIVARRLGGSTASPCRNDKGKTFYQAWGIVAAVPIRVKDAARDLSLPQLDGWEATRQLKERVDTHFIPVLAFTAHVLPDETNRALTAGCAAIITKPFDIGIFLDTIGWLLQGTEERSVGS